MTKEVIENAATAYLAPKVLRNFRFSWLAYGALAYVALRYMKSKGMLPKQGEAALDLVDRGFETAKSKMGFHTNREVPVHH